MLNGHGDDLYNYPDIRINFSSNIYNHFDHSGLFAYLSERMNQVTHYPEPTPVTLEKAIAADLGIKSSQVMVTNGATEAIYLIARAYEGSVSSIDNPTFSEYEEACKRNGHSVVHSFNESIDIFHDTRKHLLWLCEPNNPTGIVRSVSEMQMLMQSCERDKKILVIDASYARYTTEKLISPVEAIRNCPYIIMIHSMTKDYGVPGLRIGYITGNEDVLKRIREYSMPWSVNQLAQDAGLYLLKHQKDYRLDALALTTERKRVAAALNEIMEIRVFPSDCNFLLCKINCCSAAELKEYLAEKHEILIRDAANFRGLSEGHFRIAVQTPEEDDELIEAISAFVKERRKDGKK